MIFIIILWYEHIALWYDLYVGIDAVGLAIL